jgi:hypothetical protein
MHSIPIQRALTIYVGIVSFANAIIAPASQRHGSPELFPMPLCHGLTLEEATIDQMQYALSNGKLTSQQLVECYMQRIYQTDQYIKYVTLAHCCWTIPLSYFLSTTAARQSSTKVNLATGADLIKCPHASQPRCHRYRCKPRCGA